MPSLRRVLVLVAVAVAAIGGIALARLDRQVRAYLAGPALGAVRIYAAPTVLRRDAPVPGGSLARKLARLGYRQAEGGALVAGTYRAAGGAVEIAPRPSPAPWAPAPRPARVAVQGRRVADIRAADGTPLDTVYLGEDGAVPIHGFAEAADAYFAKPLGELGPAECALLAGIIRSPNGLAPRQHADAALARRNRVLAAMVEDGALDEAAGQRARGEPLRLAPPHARPVGALYVADEVARELGRLLPPDAARAPGLAVFTAVDADAQREAERAVRRRLESSDRARARRRRDPGSLQAALVALDPTSGRILALVGGHDYGSSPLDRAVRARRQPGSAFKPFVYLAALDPARRPDMSARTVVSPLDDSPLAVAAGGHVWRPANYDG